MHALCYWLPSLFSSLLLGAICSNKICPGCLGLLESRAGWYTLIMEKVDLLLLVPGFNIFPFVAQHVRFVFTRCVGKLDFYVNQLTYIVIM